MRAFPILSLIALVALTSAAQAAPMDVQAMMMPDGRFGYCQATNTYSDGRKLAIEIDGAGEIDLLVTVPNGGFAKGRKYDLLIGLDDALPRRVRALAQSEQELRLDMGVNELFKKTLATSKQLKIGSAGTPSMAFDLPSMGAVMQRMQVCADQQRPQARAGNQPAPSAALPAAPQASKQEKTKSAAKQNEPEKSGFPQPLYQLLTEAGLEKVQPLSMDDVPVAQRPADYIWQTGSVLGGVRERALPDGHTLSELIGIHTQGLKDKCPGPFHTEINKEQKEGALTLRTAWASCAPAKGQKGDTIVVGLVFYLTQKNVFAVFTHEGPEKAKKEILSVREKLSTFLLNLARREAR